MLGALRRNRGPVSYTHLDVYKRQLFWFIGFSLTSAANVRTLAPVSYTHLDVYKRQVQAFQNRPHIFNLGHGITPNANPDNVTRMIETVRGGGRG